MFLDKCSKVMQGVILARIETHPGPDTIPLSLYTMKEMNESIGVDYRGSIEKLQKVHVPKNRVDELPIAKEGMILINLTAHKAVSVRPEHAGKLITSNFAVIETNEKLNPLYFEWYFNEHPSCRKHLRIATQGSIVSALSIQMLRSLEIELPSLRNQEKLGHIYQLTYKKKRLTNERLMLEEKLTKQLLLNYLKEEN
ncbi:hypothetical protein HUN92_21565 [Bacillus firmus]|uniref:hypothetical protein n=1 Tax=Cytobacillus firmus TaxID=1399 RepID=UPI001580A0B3|nr:hypothetical protein [Cytobacillus firmus]NUH86238.1 hypothetical protein [Cytobacillus firmus]